jgi:hypothetical protein
VFYHVPRPAADRAIRRVRHRIEQRDAERSEGEPTPAPLREYLYGEVRETPVIYGGGEPLAEYAAGRVDRLQVRESEG